MLNALIELVDTYWLYFLVGQYPEGPLGGLALTVLLSLGALLLAMPLGLLLGVARVSSHRAIRWPVASLVQLVRAVPLLLVVFWVYFFLPAVTGVKTGQATTMLMVLVLFDGIYLADQEVQPVGVDEFNHCVQHGSLMPDGPDSAAGTARRQTKSGATRSGRPGSRS